MRWYDVFSRFYDAQLEPLYAGARTRAAEVLAPDAQSVVLDLPCGTGQSFGPILARGATASVIGVDLSPGMVRIAKARVAAQGGQNVSADVGDVHALDRVNGVPAQVDRIHVFLGMSVFPEWEAAFAKLWDRLAPGGRIVLVDVYAETKGLQSHLVELVARADLSRKFWEPLERVAADFHREALPAKKEYGGTLFLATGTKPLVRDPS
jgi:SAM-dependent methyltransferase